MKIQICPVYALLILISLLILNSCGTSSLREKIELGGEWAFCTDSGTLGTDQHWPETGINKNNSIKVKVPHAWNSMTSLSRYWGKAWYEREVSIPSGWRGKSVRIQFDAVFHDAKIWVNGKYAGKHDGSGYTRFSLSLDSLIKPGEINRITVLVDNSASRLNLPFMKSYDWANDGGIIRKVRLLMEEKQGIQSIRIEGHSKEGENGIFTGVINISIKPGKVKADEIVSFEGEIAQAGILAKEVIWKGKLEGSTANEEFKCKLDLKNIKNWHFDQPVLYVMKIRMKVNGRHIDEDKCSFAFRKIEVSDSHFILNGEAMRIAGMEWMPGSSLESGMAETEKELATCLKLMKGANAVYTRFHWQQDEFVLDWCDHNGIMVQEEIPAWGWETKLNDSLFGVAKMQIKEMVEDHFQHPCIISWGIGNELDSHDSTNLRYFAALYKYTRSLDSTKLINYVSNQLNQPLRTNRKTLPDASNLGNHLMFNEYYSSWYNQNVDSVSPALDRIHKDYPGKAIVISEFGICEPVFKGGDPRRKKEMREQFNIYGSKPYIAGAIYFCLNDYRTHMGEDYTYSYPQRVHGVTDIHLKPKASYFELKSILSPVEIVSISKKDGIAQVSLKCKTGIPSYTVRNYTLRTGKDEKLTGEMNPGERRMIEIKYRQKSDTLKLQRPTGAEVFAVPL